MSANLLGTIVFSIGLFMLHPGLFFCFWGLIIILASCGPDLDEPPL